MNTILSQDLTGLLTGINPGLNSVRKTTTKSKQG